MPENYKKCEIQKIMSNVCGEACLDRKEKNLYGSTKHGFAISNLSLIVSTLEKHRVSEKENVSPVALKGPITMDFLEKLFKVLFIANSFDEIRLIY